MTRLCNLIRWKERRHQLRRQRIPSEARLWTVLRNRQFRGLKFRRQHSIGWYIIDFYCPQLRLAVEVDGESHLGRETADRRRQRWLEGHGVTVFRCASIDVLRNLDGVIQRLEGTIEQFHQLPHHNFSEEVKASLSTSPS